MGAVVKQPLGVLGTLRTFLETIKFSHTVFALPFAFTGAVLAASGLPSLYQAFWILMAMVGARTAAMGLNRLIDAELDRANPRTCGRAIPAGLLGKNTVFLCSGAAVILFFVAAYRLNHLCFILSPLALFLLVVYSYCKRFTALSHVVLGLCLAVAPVGAWIAVRGSVELSPFILGVAVLFWVAGFDILYALQDLEFDRSAGLCSIPARFGARGALLTARLFHVVTCVMLLFLAVAAGLGIAYLAGVCIAVLLLSYEHWLVKDGDLAKLDAAFFTMNGYISITVFFFTLGDVLFR
ncbi:MAG: putative 4-hydroxybenzoate polyprenyltransferase [Geobacteraceae bacterium]|nr:putative 4-hydroxybenzoate polyprenyltransferase [Geobacteraceae bacterium]